MTPEESARDRAEAQERAKELIKDKPKIKEGKDKQ